MEPLPIRRGASLRFLIAQGVVARNQPKQKKWTSSYGKRTGVDIDYELGWGTQTLRKYHVELAGVAHDDCERYRHYIDPSPFFHIQLFAEIRKKDDKGNTLETVKKTFGTVIHDDPDFVIYGDDNESRKEHWLTRRLRDAMDAENKYKADVTILWMRVSVREDTA